MLHRSWCALIPPTHYINSVRGENAKLLLNKRWIQNSALTVSAYSDRLCWWLPVITSEIAANTENWQGCGVYTQYALTFAHTDTIWELCCNLWCVRSLYLPTIWKGSFENAIRPLKTESSSLSFISILKLKCCRSLSHTCPSCSRLAAVGWFCLFVFHLIFKSV